MRIRGEDPYDLQALQQGRVGVGGREMPPTIHDACRHDRAGADVPACRTAQEHLWGIVLVGVIWVSGIYWSDWGDATRIQQDRARFGLQPRRSSTATRNAMVGAGQGASKALAFREAVPRRRAGPIVSRG
jgi:hypothetical protein